MGRSRRGRTEATDGRQKEMEENMEDGSRKKKVSKIRENEKIMEVKRPQNKWNGKAVAYQSISAS